MNLETINKDELFSDRWIPYRMEIVRSPVLSASAKVLYAEIVSYFWQDNAHKAWPAQRTLAVNLNCSVETVRKHLKELAGVGVIVISRRGLGKNNEYFLLKPDPVRLQVEKNAKGDWKPITISSELDEEVSKKGEMGVANPVVVTDAKKPTDQETKKPTDQETKRPTDQEYGKPNGDIPISGAVSLGVAQVSEIVLSDEEKVTEIKSTEEQVSADRSFSHLEAKDKETDMIDMGSEWRRNYASMQGDNKLLSLDERAELCMDNDTLTGVDWDNANDKGKLELLELFETE